MSQAVRRLPRSPYRSLPASWRARIAQQPAAADADALAGGTVAGIGGLLLLLCLAANPANAIDIADAYRDAVKNDPVLGAAEASYDARLELVPQARADLLPKMSFSAATSWNERSFPVEPRLDFNPESPTFGTVAPVADQNFNEHQWQARINQPIFNLSSWHNLRSAKARVTGAEANLAEARQSLIVRVVEAYLNVLRAQDRLDATVAQETAVNRQLEQVQQRFDVGLVAITDVLEARAGYDHAVVDRIQANGDRYIFFETLQTLVGASFASLARLSENLPVDNPEPRDEEQWVQTALSTNLRIAAARAQLNAAQRAVAARRSGHLPTLEGGLSRSYFSTGGASFIANETKATVWSLSMNLPIYQGGFTLSRTREARALAEQAREELLNQQLTVSRDTRNLFQRLATDVVRVRAWEKAIASSKSALEATETGYEVGTRNIVDVLQAQQRLYASQFDYADSRYNYVIDLMRLKQTSGTLAEEDLTELNRFTDSSAPVTRNASLRNRDAEM